MKNARNIAVIGASLLLAACQTAAPTSPTVSPFEAPPQARCAGEPAYIDTAFDTGALASCSFTGNRHVQIHIAPEDEPPINCSAWYAFRVTPNMVGELTLDLSYEDCGHRYWPKISKDGADWTPLPQSAVSIYQREGVAQARLQLPLGDEPYFVAGQEIIDPAHYEAWLAQLASHPATRRWQLGSSAQGRSIPAMTIAAPGTSPREQIVLIGRQHPPEITGYFALRSFVATILGEDELASAFRNRFEVTLVPMLNPDGVVLGHWRHGTRGVDLNRDWGPFTQPETRLIGDLLAAMDLDENRQLRLFLDFHSTQNDVFYTIPATSQTNPPGFIADWLGHLAQAMPDYTINEDANHNPGSATSKGYVYSTYGVPTTTFEIGDETDRALIVRIGREAAIAMMETLLQTPGTQPAD